MECELCKRPATHGDKCRDCYEEDMRRRLREDHDTETRVVKQLSKHRRDSNRRKDGPD